MFNPVPQNRLTSVAPQPVPDSRSTDWSPQVQTLLDDPPSTFPVRLAYGGLVFTVCFAAWAWFGQVNDMARAQGKLVPQGEVFRVNPVEMGKVARVLVREGEPVKAGQVLAELDSEVTAKEVERLEKELSASRTELNQMQLLIEQAQLQAQARAAMAQAQTRAQKIEVLKAQESIGNTEVLLSQTQQDIDAHKARLERLQPLVTEGAIPQEQVFQAEQELRNRDRSVTEYTGTLQQSHAEVKRLQEALAQQQADERNIQLEAQQNIQQLRLRQSQLQAKINQLTTMIAAANLKLKDRYIYAPIDGMISTLQVRNSGEVVQPGQTVAEIAPRNRPLVLSAMLPNQEAGLVKLGMRVQVKLDAFPYQDYGVITGKVKRISPDAKPDEQLGQVYRVEIELDRNFVTKLNQKHRFKSGQTATAEIVTRQRRIVDVFLDPVRELQNGGLTL